MTTPSVTEEASEAKQKEFAEHIEEIAEVAFGPLRRLEENPKEAVGVSFLETAGQIHPGTFRGEIRSKIQDVERLIRDSAAHVCAKQGVEYRESRHRKLRPKAGILQEKLQDHLFQVEKAATELRDCFFEFGEHSDSNYGIGPAISSAVRNFRNPLNALQSLTGQHPIQKRSKELETDLDRTLSRYADAVGALLTDLGNEVGDCISSFVEEVRNDGV